MRKLTIVLLLFLCSCGSTKVVSEKDITDKVKWLESNKDNPIINVIQKIYNNEDVEIVIKKKITTDYIKITSSKNKRIINKKTVVNK
jgi:hypothetical protein|tara:strand:- start:1041 stop:1301 length:261 start_codon:yes stop_codon:yes gene_type:complete